MLKILFVCMGNTCRSPMAEYILKSKIKKHNLEDKIEAKSAGMFVSENSQNPSALAIQVLNEDYKIDMSVHKPQMVNIDLIMGSDLILCMEENISVYLKANLHNIDENSISLISAFKEYVGEKGDVADPYGGNLNTYKSTAKELDTLIDLLLKKINL